MANAIHLDPDRAGRLAQVVCDDIAQAEIDRGDYLRQVKEHRGLLKPHQELQNPPFEGACDLHVPFLRYARNALLARVRRALLGTTPIFYVEGQGPAAQWSGPVEAFLQRQALKQMKLPQQMRRVLQASLDDGVGIAYVTWRTEKRRALQYVPARERLIDEETGEILAEPGQIGKTRPWVTRYDGPQVEFIPIEHFGTFPAANADIERSTGIYLRAPMSGDELLTGAAAGDYDPQAVAALERWMGDANALERSDEENRGITATESSFAVDPSFTAAQFQITECYWKYEVGRMKDEPHTPAEDWLITLHEPSQTVLRALPAVEVWGHGLRPVAPIRLLPDKFGILGDSLADLAGEPQQFITTLMRQLVNGARKRGDPELFIMANAMSKDEFDDFKASRGPGTYHPIRNINQVGEALYPLRMEGNPLELLPVIEKIHDWARNATGVSNLTMGQLAPHAVTAREVERMLEEGQESVMDMVDTASEGLAQVGQLIAALDYVFAGRDSVQRLWAEANPRADVDALTALGGVYDISAAGSTAASNKAIRKQQALEKYQIFKDDPFVQANPKRMWALRRDLLNALGERNVEAVIGPEQEVETMVRETSDPVSELAGDQVNELSSEQVDELASAGVGAQAPEW
ncbi:MAG: portal protein [Armatimonadota bacterium]